MGDENSGRRPGFAIRETVEGIGAVELHVRSAARSFQVGTTRTCSWSVDGKEIASVSLRRIDLYLVEVSYVKCNDPGSSPVSCAVQLTTDWCNFGGERFWFQCPTCRRRTGSIFIVGPPFQCRVCLRLTYRSQRERHVARVLRKASSLRNRLRGTGDAFSFGSKPKGMHWRTYKRVTNELRELRWAFLGGLAVQFRLPGFEHPRDLEEDDLGYRKKRAYHRRDASSE
jgi:hypothetical protein